MLTFRIFRLLVFISSIVLAFGCAITERQVKGKQTVEVRKAIEITDSSKVKTIGLHNVAIHMRRGTILGKLANGPFCLNALKEMKWKLGRTVVLSKSKSSYLSDNSGEDFFNIFREELESHGWPVAGKTDDLFQGYDVSEADVLIAALVTDLKSALCAPLADYVELSPLSNMPYSSFDVNKFMGLKHWDMNGSMTTNVEWQIYSPARHSLIGTIETTGSAEIKKESDDATYELLLQSFRIATNNLLASEELLKMVGKSEDLIDTPSRPKTCSVINEDPNYRTFEAAINAAKRSTLTVRTTTGHGSGFVVGDGNMLLTNAHVVKNAKTVTLVTKEGINFDGKVAKVSKERDVALITIDALRLPALHINDTIPAPGSRALAVGSPLMEELNSSVTEGVVHGIREMRGYSWIQSDAAINSGNSGGPLIDNKGSVIGIATLSYGGEGLNLFVPITNALEFVGLCLE